MTHHATHDTHHTDDTHEHDCRHHPQHDEGAPRT